MSTADAPALSYSSAPGRWVLAITVLGSGIAALDATVVNIALPTIGRDFHTSIAALQWVMTSYILALTAFLLIGGSLGDRFGRRKVYLTGIVCLARASRHWTLRSSISPCPRPTDVQAGCPRACSTTARSCRALPGV
jgi:MFS family permease